MYFSAPFPALTPSDGVGLVVKDIGSQSFYRGQTAEDQISELRSAGIRSSMSTGT